jgi:Tfp pilus assembly protein PilX
MNTQLKSRLSASFESDSYLATRGAMGRANALASERSAAHGAIFLKPPPEEENLSLTFMMVSPKIVGASSERGVALAAVLLAISMFTLIGLTMAYVSSTEVLINQNTRMKLVNLYLAESASEEARERIKDLLLANLLSWSDPNKVVYIVANSSINPISGDAHTNPYFDSTYSPSHSVSIVNSTMSDIGFFWVKVRQKTETRAGYSLSNHSPTDEPVFYGYNSLQPGAQLTQYVNAGTHMASHTGTPVYLVTAFARSAGEFRQSVITDIALFPVPLLKAAVFSKDAVQVLGSGVIINGNDQSSADPRNLNGVESASTISGDLTGVTGSPLPDRPLSPHSYSVSNLINSLRPPFAKEVEQVAPSIVKLPDGSYVGSGVSLGSLPSEGDSPQTTYVNGPLNLSDSTGQGILVVDGDFSVTGSFTFYGLIIVAGKIHLNGTSAEGISIQGAIISSSVSGSETSILEGTVRIFNDSTAIQKQFAALHYVRLAFRET